MAITIGSLAGLRVALSIIRKPFSEWFANGFFAGSGDTFCSKIEIGDDLAKEAVGRGAQNLSPDAHCTAPSNPFHLERTSACGGEGRANLIGGG